MPAVASTFCNWHPSFVRFVRKLAHGVDGPGAGVHGHGGPVCARLASALSCIAAKAAAEQHHRFWRIPLRGAGEAVRDQRGGWLDPFQLALDASLIRSFSNEVGDDVGPASTEIELAAFVATPTRSVASYSRQRRRAGDLFTAQRSTSSLPKGAPELVRSLMRPPRGLLLSVPFFCLFVLGLSRTRLLSLGLDSCFI